MKMIKQISSTVFKFDEVEVDFSRQCPMTPKVNKDGFVFDGECRCEAMVDGARYQHPVWQMWSNMKARTTSKAYQNRRRTYVGTSVCPEWRRFSTFEAWVLKQHDWLNREIDKDLLVPGNKIYSPETCVFVPQAINKMLLARGAARGDLPLGVTITKTPGHMMAHCADGSGVEIVKSFGVKHFDLNSARTKEAAALAHQFWQTTKADVIRSQVKVLLDPRHDMKSMKRLIAIAARLDFNAKCGAETFRY